MFKYLKIDLKEVFQPKFFDIIKNRSYDKQTFVADLIAGIIVGIVAIPLAIAFGIASGVTPQQGLITAIIAGFIISALGGSSLQIGGPTGAFIVIVYGIMLEFGMSGLTIATILAGLMLIAMGVFKLGGIVRFMPYPIIVGFTSGIAVTIFSSQIKDFLGLRMGSPPADFIDKWISYFQNITTVNVIAILVSLLTIAIIALWPRVTKKVPGSLIAIILITVGTVLMHHFTPFQIETIGTKFPELTGGGSGAPILAPEYPTINMKAIRMLIQPAFTIAILCAIESLLSATVVDGITGKRHRSNTELIAQGVANVVVPIFGGIPATGGIARTMANVNNGGKTPIAGMIHAVVLLLIFLFFMPLVAHIPMACMAGVLIMVSYNMSGWRSFRAILRSPRADVAVLLTSFFLTVIVDLTIAIEVGVIISLVLFFKSVTDTSSIERISSKMKAGEEFDFEGVDEEIVRPENVEIYEINGPFAFGIANKFDEVDYEVTKRRPKVRIIRMRRVPFIDSTGIQNLRLLYQKAKAEKIQIILSDVSLDVYKTLYRSGFIKEEITRHFVFDNIKQALQKAQLVVSQVEEKEKKKEREKSSEK